MKRNVYKLDDIDCAACSLKLEEAINKLDGVCECIVNYMMLKLVVSFNEDIISEDVIEREIFNTLSDVRIISKNDKPYENEEDVRDSIKRRLFFRKRK